MDSPTTNHTIAIIGKYSPAQYKSDLQNISNVKKIVGHACVVKWARQNGYDGVTMGIDDSIKCSSTVYAYLVPGSKRIEEGIKMATETKKNIKIIQCVHEYIPIGKARCEMCWRVQPVIDKKKKLNILHTNNMFTCAVCRAHGLKTYNNKKTSAHKK